MRIDAITLEGFRNYAGSSAAFAPGANVIIGRNAQGKTNLLEAAALLASGRSFRARSDSELVGFGRDEAAIRAEFTSGGRAQKMELILRRGRRKTVTVNGVKLRSPAELSGKLTAVLFCPDDLELVRGGAAPRRRLMDLCIVQLRPRYAAALASFTRTWEEKTRILRDAEEKPSLLSALDEYDDRMARLSAELIHTRALFLKRLAPEAAAIHAEFSGGEKLGIEYRTVGGIEDPQAPAAELYPLILRHMQARRAAERAACSCLVGAHKDDLEITVDGAPARSFASQGQARTAALSLKLAERELHFSESGEYPVLLLDDVLSELDEGRQNFVLNRIGGGQVFITCCEDDRIAERTGGKVLRVENGVIF